MKNILLENMLRFGTKNLSNEAQQTLSKLAEQTTGAVMIKNHPDLLETFNNGGGVLTGDVYFRIGNTDVISSGTTIIPSIFGTTTALVAVDLFKAVPSKTNTGGLATFIKAAPIGKFIYQTSNGAISEFNNQIKTPINQVNQGNKAGTAGATAVTNDNQNANLTVFNTGIKIPNNSAVVALELTKKYIKDTATNYAANLQRIMLLLADSKFALSTPWDLNAIAQLETYLSKDPITQKSIKYLGLEDIKH